MNIGEMRHLIQIQSCTSEPDDMGGEVENWKDICKAWAKVESAKNLVGGNFQETEKETLKMTIRYTDLNMENMRVKFLGKFYTITQIINPEFRNEQLELFCEAQ